MHGAFVCIKFNCSTHVQFSPSEFGTQVHNIWLVLTLFWSLLSSNWSKYLKCWVFNLFRFAGTISTCERFLGKSFFNVFHPFPHFQPFFFCLFEGHYCWLSSHWVGVPFHHRNYDWYCTLIGFQPSKQPVVARNFHQLVLFTLRKTRTSFWEPPKWCKDDFCCWR